MNLLARFTRPSYTAWKADFGAHAEARDQSGLTLLQLWRSADHPNRGLALFEVHDRAAHPLTPPFFRVTPAAARSILPLPPS